MRVHVFEEVRADVDVELPRRLILLYSYETDLICDPFLGSGTTLLACRATGRQGIGFEKNADYAALAERRLATLNE